VRDRLQDGTQRLEADSHVEEVRGIEEVVEVTEQREDEVPGDVQERLPYRYSSTVIIASQQQTNCNHSLFRHLKN